VTIAYLIRAIQRHRELETASSLVLEMLDRGISPEDITAVLKTMGLEPPADFSAQGLRLKFRTRDKQAGSPSTPGSAEATTRA
jgi:pentatricopeptide repeat protein